MNVYQYVVYADPRDIDSETALCYCAAGTSVAEARALAEEHNACLVELTFSYDDSELIEDFREGQ
jgi:hypothetical protein